MVDSGQLTIKIPSGQALSDVADIYTGKDPVALVVPAGWTPANITVQGSMDGATFFDMYKDDGTEKVITASASRWVALNVSEFIGFKYIRLRSGTSGTPVTQSADRLLMLIYA